MNIPCDIKLETSFLGGILIDREKFLEVRELFHEELFYQKENKIIARVFILLDAENIQIDLLTVTDKIKRLGLSKECSAYHVSASTDNAALSNFTEKVLALNEYYIRRSLIFKNTELSNRAAADGCDAVELLGEQEKAISDITKKLSVSRTPDANDCHFELVKHLQKLENLKTGELSGINTGFTKLNDLTGGWQKSDLMILAGRPAMGKTSLALNMAVAAVICGEPVLIFSLEMSKLQLYARICSQITQIPLYKFLKEKMDLGEKMLFERDTADLWTKPLYIEDKGGIDLNFIRMKARKLARDKGIKLIIIDYLQLIDKAKSNKSTNDEISVISGGLKGLAKELDIPIIALSQLTREVEKTPDKRPSLHHLRDGGSIEQDADMVMFVYRPEYYGITDDGSGNSTVGKAEIMVAKHRNGALDDILIGFNGQCTNFYDLNKTFTPLQANTDFL